VLRTARPVKECPGEARNECTPLAPIPAWWSGFLFHILNPRQVCMYVYLTMLDNGSGSCNPTIEQIREDLGLYSSSMVFEALAALEDLCFITRERRAFPGTRAKRNVYGRPSCEKTILRLLERNLVDGMIRPAGENGSPASAESRQLVYEGLRALLGEPEFERYSNATPAAKRDVLVEVLEVALAEHGNATH